MWANTVGSLGASLIWGIAFANLVQGVPIDSSGTYTGTFWDLFSWYTLWPASPSCSSSPSTARPS